MTAHDTTEPTERRFLRSTVAAYGSLFGRMVISFVAKLILARLVIPEGHGLYEEALRIVIVASALRDLGLPYHLMRDPRKPYGTVLAFVVGSGAAVSALLFALAPAFSFLTPELPPVLRVFSVWVLLDGLVVVPRAFFDRELRIGRMVGPEIWRGLTMAGVSVGLAALGWGVWSFVAGDLAAAALFAALVWWRARRELPRAVDWSLIPGLLRRSTLLFVIWAVLQLVTYLDIYVVQLFSTTSMVGQYARAYMVAFLVSTIVAPRALLPALVEYRDDPDRFRDTFRLSAVFLLSFQVVSGYFLHFNAAKVVAVLLGDQWGPAVPLLEVLALVPFVHIFNILGGEVLKVRNEDRLWLAAAGLNLVSLVTFGVAFSRRFGAIGMAYANFFLLGELLMVWRLAAAFAPRFGRVVRDLALVYLAPLPFFVAAAWLYPADTWSRAAASLVAAAAGGGVLAWRFYRPFREFFGASSRA